MPIVYLDDHRGFDRQGDNIGKGETRNMKKRENCGPVRRCLCKHRQVEGGIQADSAGEMFSFILFRRNHLLGLRSTVVIRMQRAAGGGILLS